MNKITFTHFNKLYQFILIGIFLVIGTFLIPNQSLAVIDCLAKYGGVCRSFSCPDGYANIGDQGCGWTTGCCAPAQLACSVNAKGTCVGAGQCPGQSSNAAFYDYACKKANPATPICCARSQSACISKGGSCKNSCNPATEVSLGTEYDLGCKEGAWGNFCCINKTEYACESQGGKCSEGCKSGEKQVDDSKSCENRDHTQPYCCVPPQTSSNNCLDHQAEGYYCVPSTSACKTGDAQASGYLCPTGSSQICCKSANSGVGGTGPGGSTGGGPTSQQPYAFTNPIGWQNFTAVIVAVLSTVQQVVGWLAVIMIVAGALMYVISGGSGLTDMAKATITWALAGFAIAVAGPSILRELYEVFTSGATSGASVIDSANPIQKIVANILNFLLTAVGILAIIGFVISGIMFATSAGDTSRADTARKAMGYTLMGIVVAGAGLILVKQILSLAAGQ